MVDPFTEYSKCLITSVGTGSLKAGLLSKDDLIQVIVLQKTYKQMFVLQTAYENLGLILK